MKNKLREQFEKLIEKPLHQSRLTKDLYIELHTRGSMIAHFDKSGFHKARFCTLRDFDQTIESIRSSKNLKYLLENISVEKLAMARFQIAQSEAQILKKQAEVFMYHAAQLQTKFSKEF